MQTTNTREVIVVALPRLQLPFEVWRPIFQIVFATPTAISHPPSDFIFSPLHSRLNIYRCLARVSRVWRTNARDVFFEELDAFTADALKGIITTFQRDRSLALVVSRLSFSFGEFRCSASTPRRPRPLRPNTDLGIGAGASAPHRLPDWKVIHRRDAARYQPSNTAQGYHWTRWQADVGQILAMCTSLSEVKIISTNQSQQYYHSFSRDYRSWFAPPDLTNENVLDGLLCSTNLRFLQLIDPTPLERFGPALASWERLHHITIVLTRPFDELQHTIFVPPKSLVSFRFLDQTTAQIPWPLASDLARCTNLQVLHLGVTSLKDTSPTAKAIAYLCTAYQHSLKELILQIIHGQDRDSSFQGIIQSVSPLHFKKLQRLHLPGASYDSSVFSYFKADDLKLVEVGWLALEPAAGSREDKWNRALSHASLRALKQLVINQDDPDTLRKQALIAVCQHMEITLFMGRPPPAQNASQVLVPALPVNVWS